MQTQPSPSPAPSAAPTLPAPSSAPTIVPISLHTLRLAAFAREHGCPCRPLPNGMLRIAYQCAGAGAKGFSWMVETIPATASRVRDFLGY